MPLNVQLLPRYVSIRVPTDMSAVKTRSNPGNLTKRKYLSRSNSVDPPELRLIIAILEDAIRCFRTRLFLRGRYNRQPVSEAESWIMSTDAARPFSFEHVCEVVGIDPAYLRRQLRTWRDRQLTRSRADAE